MKLREKIYRTLFPDKYLEFVATHAALKESEAKLAAADKALERVRPRPARFERYRAMNDEQLGEVLAGGSELPAMKAVMQMIDEKFQQASDAASDPKLLEGETKFHLGGADWMVRLKGELQAATEKERSA